MAHSTKKEIQIDDKKFWEIIINEYDGTKEVQVDHDFTFGYCYMNDMNKTIHKAFNISKLGSCNDPNCFVRRQNKGKYIVRWRGMENNKYSVIVTVSNL